MAKEIERNKVVRTAKTVVHDDELNELTQQPTSEARGVRSKYSDILNRICEGKDEIGNVDSEKFKEIMKEIENSHYGVKKPREQVADAEALFDLTKTLAASVRSHSTGVTPYIFVSSLLDVFGTQRSKGRSVNANALWKDIGLAVSPIFRNAGGCLTMLGPMNCEVKCRKVTRRPRTKVHSRACPKELEVNAEEKTDTDKNILTMFQILRKKKRVKLESLIMNRKSFAQSIENLFTLSFLVKDGRVFVDVDESGSHFVSPRNGPDATAVKSGEVKYSHFVFRLDFADWELMKNVVPEGDELMPNRDISTNSGITESKPVLINDSRPILNVTWVEKFSRNRGKVLREASEVDEAKPVLINDSRPILNVTWVKKFSRNRGKVLCEASEVDDSREIGDANICNGSLKRKLL